MNVRKNTRDWSNLFLLYEIEAYDFLELEAEMRFKLDLLTSSPMFFVLWDIHKKRILRVKDIYVYSNKILWSIPSK